MKKYFFLFFAALVLLGCRSTEDTIFHYVGTWSGLYSGNDTGNWNLVISLDGKVKGTMSSTVNQENYVISGTVDNTGLVSAVLADPADGKFIGNIDENHNIKGNWINRISVPTKSGLFEGKKNK